MITDKTHNKALLSEKFAAERGVNYLYD